MERVCRDLISIPLRYNLEKRRIWRKVYNNPISIPLRYNLELLRMSVSSPLSYFNSTKVQFGGKIANLQGKAPSAISIPLRYNLEEKST